MINFDLNKYFQINLSDDQIKQFDTFYQTLINENKKYNLTSITQEDAVYEKHFYDSLSLLPYLKENLKIVDVGSGGGMPGLPNKIASPKLNITFLDSTNKKIEFIKLVSEKLNLTNNYIVGRAEEVKEKFDIVVARGVASLNVLLELCCSLVKQDGILIAMKGSSYKEEIATAANCIDKLGYKLIDTKEYILPNEKSTHVNLIFKKIKNHNEKYPRNYAQIKKKPL